MPGEAEEGRAAYLEDVQRLFEQPLTVSSALAAPRVRSPRVVASARARAASFERRAERSTTTATAAETPTKTRSARTFWGSLMVRVPTGGVEK